MLGIRERSIAFTLAALAAVVLASACGARPNNVSRVKDFVNDLNKHDMNAAMSLTASNFSLVGANGQAMQGSAATSALAALPTPITLVSVTQKGGHRLSAVLSFGSSPQTTVEFAGNSTSSKGRGGHILRMSIARP